MLLECTEAWSYDASSSFFKMSKKECHGYRLDRALIFTTVNETKLTEIGPGLQRRKIDFTCRHLISSYD